MTKPTQQQRIDRLSKEAQSLIRRLLRDEAPGIHGCCPPESVAWECNRAGLLVQVEHPDGDAYKEMSMLRRDQFRKRAAVMGFIVPGEKS